MYQAGKPDKNKKRRRLTWLLIILFLLLLTWLSIVLIRKWLKPQTTIKQATAVKSHVNYSSKTKHYDERDFSIDLPIDWQPVPRPPGPYQTYNWQSADRITNGQLITVYEDIIPANFAVNRALIVEGQGDHLSLDGGVSDNCYKYTRGAGGTYNKIGVPAKWLGIDFLCDESNQERDVIGTSSKDGVNMVILKSQNTGESHKFLFTYTDNDITPDYSTFYNALTSLRMQ